VGAYRSGDDARTDKTKYSRNVIKVMIKEKRGYSLLARAEIILMNRGRDTTPEL